MITRRGLAGSLVMTAALATGLARERADADELDYPPNVFISPCGQPFRARIDQPYPVDQWFKQVDKDGDGKLERTEFVADAAAFFAMLDVNGDGILDSREISRYEHYIAPEVIGLRVSLGALDAPSGALGQRLWGGRLWRTQMMGGVTGIGGQPNGGGGPGEGGGTGRIQGNAPIAPEEEPEEPRPPHDIDESGQGASPYGFFAEPEPVMAADEDLNGRIRKAAFLRLADRHFDRLDQGGVGFLTLAKLPKTGIQARVERAQRALRRP